jgi:Phosphoesterase family
LALPAAAALPEPLTKILGRELNMQSKSNLLRPSLVAAAVAMAIASTSGFAAQSLVKGTVGGALFTPPVFADTAAASSASSTVASVYAGVTVCADLNGNGVCDPGEPTTTTTSTGSFTLLSPTIAPLVAQISTSATNNGAPIASRNVFRANVAQVQAATKNPLLAALVNITPLSTEVALAIENQGLTYTQAVANLAQRLNVSPNDVLVPPTQVTESTDLPAILKESVIAQNRLQLAATFVDRGDTIGELRGNFDCPNVASQYQPATFDTVNADGPCSASDLQSVASILSAEQYAFNLEGMPQYDYVFVIIEENESQSSVVGNSGVPYINQFLNNGNVLYNYFSTGDPSEPNYLALGGADDWGQTNDEAIPYPAVLGVKPNLWNAIDAQGLSWHLYEGSLWPSPAGTTANAGAGTWNTATGGAFFDNPANSSIVGADGVKYGASLVAVKHNPASWYADVVAQPDFFPNERTVSGAYGTTDVNGNAIAYAFPSNSSSTTGSNYTSAGDWDNALQAYATAQGITSWWTANTQPWVQDQLKADLQTGNVANVNFIVPDINDDMHTPSGVLTPRGDYWFQNVVTKIESSSIWNDPTKRVAIVITFDEGESATTSCCGWNAERSGDGKAQLVTFNAAGQETASIAALPAYTEAWKGSNGTTTETFTPPAYSAGNHGHGVTIFGLYTNQMALNGAPTKVYDSDYYSHFSFVRSLQDIFGLSDPGQPGTYMNRSKFTESFIDENATVLPEFAGSSNTHFDAVRAMNHVYQFPASVTRVVSEGTVTPPVTTGPDATQTNIWSQ